MGLKPKEPLRTSTSTWNTVFTMAAFHAYAATECGGFPKIKGTILGAPHNMDYSILGSILGSPYFEKLPCRYRIENEDAVSISVLPQLHGCHHTDLSHLPSASSQTHLRKLTPSLEHTGATPQGRQHHLSLNNNFRSELLFTDLASARLSPETTARVCYVHRIAA